MKVSVRELKNHLSQYLHEVSLGKFIIVTSHKVPLAKILPIPQSDNKQLLLLLQMEGVHWNGKKPTGGKQRPELKGKTAADFVIEDRR